MADAHPKDIYKDTHADRNKIKLLFCGGASAVIARTMIAPLSRTTVLFQVGGMKGAGVPEEYRKGVASALQTMFRREGFYGLFKGNGTHLIKKVPFAAIKFLSYERYKQLLTPLGREEAKTWGKFVAGGAAAMTAVLGTYPLDLVQTQLTVQTTQKHYNGIIGTLKTIVNEEGASQLYRGLAFTLVSVVPYVAINLTLWEHLKKTVSNWCTMNPFISALCGAVSGAAASTLTFPLDVVRKHMQLNHRRRASAAAPAATTAATAATATATATATAAAAATTAPDYKNYRDVVHKIWQRDGIRGFYRGLTPHYLTVIPVVSISFGVYDLLKKTLNVT